MTKIIYKAKNSDVREIIGKEIKYKYFACFIDGSGLYTSMYLSEFMLYKGMCIGKNYYEKVMILSEDGALTDNDRDIIYFSDFDDAKQYIDRLIEDKWVDIDEGDVFYFHESYNPPRWGDGLKVVFHVNSKYLYFFELDDKGQIMKSDDGGPFSMGIPMYNKRAIIKTNLKYKL